MTDGFTDHYEVLQLSSSADGETVERVYRLLAKRYHPDNRDSGDEARFREVREAYDVLHDPERRAAFDARRDDVLRMRWRIFDQEALPADAEDDERVFRGVLSLLYAMRRRDPSSGGLGSITLEEMLGVPREHLEFPLWYMRKRGLIETLPTGQLAITVDGIDRLRLEGFGLGGPRLLRGDSAASAGVAG